MNDRTTEPGEAARVNSDLRLQQVLDNSTAVVFAKDRLGRYLFVNREFERLVARTARELLGHTDEEVFPPALAVRFRHNDLRVLNDQRAIEFEETVDFDGRARTFLASKFPLVDASGLAYAVCGIATDITGRKRIEEALSSAALAVSESEGETLFRVLARYLATILGVDGAFIATYDARSPDRLYMLAFHLDGTTRESFGYPMTGTPCETVVGQGFRCYASRLMERFPRDGDFRRLGLEGYAGHPLADSQGRPLGLVSVISRQPLENPVFIESVLRIFAVRITAELERDAAARALGASQASYREIFEASEDAIFVHDYATGAIVDVNARACAVYGYSREEMLQVRLADISSGEPPYTGEQGSAWLDRARREGGARFEWHRRNRDGSLHWDEVRLKSAVIGGEPRILAFTRDISEIKAAEARRASLEARLRQAQKMEAIGQLAGGIAHDFNNLLTSIMGYIALATERDAVLGDVRATDYLGQALRSCERARDLIQQMLLFSRGQRGSPRRLVLGPVVAEAMRTLRLSLPQSLEVDLELADALPAVRLDPLHVDQVLLNLCLNASDAMGGTGRLQVGLRTASGGGATCTGCHDALAGEFVEMSVQDSGHGMTPETVERIFEPFFSTKETGKGTGMGLAIVHGVVHEHGGHVVVETAPGRGARFRVLWPVAAEDAAAQAVGQAPAPAARPERALLDGSVLVVDDEEVVGRFMRELLETRGVRAEYLSRPEAALERLRAAPGSVDAVITDFAMPKMTGLQLARALHDVRADLPVLLYSGYGESVSSDELRVAGVCALLRKPVEPAVLESALAKVLGSARA